MLISAALLCAYALWLSLQRALRARPAGGAAADALFALAFAAAHFVLYPAKMIYDDGGIVVRYMDNFAAGHFYCYNPEDGPVFGISGAVHGLLAGGLAWSHLLSPDHAVLASNGLGLFLLGLALLRILHALGVAEALRFPAWALSLLCSRYLLITAKQGLETPLHLAIVAGGILFLLRGRDRLFWFTEALMVVSKLDALPIAAVLAAARVLRAPRDLLPVAWANPLYRRVAGCAVLPGLLWLAFTFAVFDGPLPQSARAKYFHTAHPSGHWFPFLQPYIAGPFGLFLAGLLGLLLLHGLVLLVRRKPALILSQCALGLSALAYLALYYVYNPAEQMPWYYTLPDLFLVAQALVTASLAASALPARWLAPAGAAALLVYGFALWPDMSARIRGHAHHFNVIEHERMAVGQWLDREAGPADKVLLGHGHIARYCRRYVIDYSGLNSKLATELHRDIGAMAERARPEWIVMHGALPVAIASGQGYRLAASFYNAASPEATSAARGFRLGDPWRVYRRDAAARGTADRDIAADAIAAAAVTSNGAVSARGTNIVLAAGGVPAAGVELGLACSPQPAEVTVRALATGGAVLAAAAVALPARQPDDFTGGYTRAVHLDLPAGAVVDRVEIATAGGEAVTVLAPLLRAVPVAP